MASNDNSPPPTPTSPTGRRASFSPGQKLSELFGRSPPNNYGSPAYPGPISTAAANAQAQQRRRTSIASLGLSGSPTQASTFANVKNRQSSFGSSSSPSTSVNENAIEEGDAEASGPPASPSAFARRMSFGARALRDVKTGNGNATHAAAAPSVKGRGLSSRPLIHCIVFKVHWLTFVLAIQVRASIGPNRLRIERRDHIQSTVKHLRLQPQVSQTITKLRVSPLLSSLSRKCQSPLESQITSRRES